jgi:hypothetical protein
VNQEGIELLRALLERREEQHTPPPRFEPVRYYIRRNPHRTYMRVIPRVPNRQRCRPW